MNNLEKGPKKPQTPEDEIELAQYHEELLDSLEKMKEKFADNEELLKLVESLIERLKKAEMRQIFLDLARLKREVQKIKES